ncbi:MAG TPA: carbohydrate kinase family protein [Candidatus Paceibacterota bacterium]|nr:carbohydrate kinase family protein [Candidatus Paceibacterota bacterium]
MFDVITIGTATRDVFLQSSLFKVLKDPAHLKKIGFKTGEAECFALGSKIEVSEPVFSLGGGAANAAVTFARQGLRTAALIRIGADETGESIIKSLKGEKVTPLVVTDKKEKTGYSTILLTPGGERTILVHRGASTGFKRREIPFPKLKCRFAYIAPGTIQPAVLRDIVATLKRGGTTIAMNPSKHYLEKDGRLVKPLANDIDIFIVNREEASYLTGVNYSDPRRIFKKLDEFIKGVAIMTDGPKGAYVSDGEYFYQAKTFKERMIVDRTGAGDAFGSGFVAALIQKKDILRALRLASANATSVVEAVGAEKGILRRKDLAAKRWQYLDMDFEPL